MVPSFSNWLPVANRDAWRWGLRVFAGIALAGVLYWEIAGKKNLPEITTLFLFQWRQANPGWLLAAICLFPVNWLIEAQKWRIAMPEGQPMPLKQALAALCVGVATGVLTPNRVGEFGGRLLLVHRARHWSALAAHAVGSLAQQLVLVAGGLAGGLWFWVVTGSSRAPFPEMWWGLPVLLLLAPGVVIYFNIQAFKPVFKRLTQVTWLAPLANRLLQIPAFTPEILWSVLLLSLARYVVYATQYWLLLRFLGLQSDVLTLYAGIAFVFLVQTILPLPMVSGLLVRGNLAVLIWSAIGANELSSLTATFLLWIINLIVPALVGTFFVFSVSIAKTMGYKDDE